MLDEQDQIAVARGLRAGDRNVWTALYDGYSVDVWRYAARLLATDAAGVADVVQETFMAAGRSARQFDSGRGTLWTWLTGIAHHQVSLYWRQVGRSARLRKLFEENSNEIRNWFPGRWPGRT